MGTDIKNQAFNSSTVDVVAVQVSISATDRAGVAQALGEYDAGVLPAGAIIKSAYMDVKTAFNGTSPTLMVGVTSDKDEYFAATAATAGVKVGSLGLNLKTTVTEDIVITLGGSTTSTVGEATVYIEYIDTAARREIFTV